MHIIAPASFGALPGGGIKNHQFKYSTKPDRTTTVDILPSAPIWQYLVSGSLFSPKLVCLRYQGISPVSGLFSSLKNFPVGPSLSIKAYFKILFPASSTLPVPRCPLKSVFVNPGQTAFILKLLFFSSYAKTTVYIFIADFEER